MNGIIIDLCCLLPAYWRNMWHFPWYLSVQDNFLRWHFMHQRKSAAWFCSVQQKTDETYWNFTWQLRLYSEREIKIKASRFCFSCVSPVIKFSVPSPLHIVLVSTACSQVKDRGNLFSLKLHDRAWRQQAVAWLQSMPLPYALAVCHCLSAGRDVFSVDPRIRT